MFCCPLCEETVSDCICGFGVEKENDKSITLTSEDDLRVCAACGVFTKSCLCDFQCNNLNLDTGICSKCGVFQPGHQVCPRVVISSESKSLKSGESIRIKSNIIITEFVGDNAGFLTISRKPQNYWLGSVVN